MLNNLEAMINNQMEAKHLNINNDRDHKKIAKFALKMYNKLNGTNFKSKSPKIIVFKVNSNSKRKLV